MRDLLDYPILFVFLFFVMLGLLIIGVRYTDISYVNNVPVEVTKDNITIYEGINGCISVSSSGDTTSVTIKDGFLCMFPKEYYVGQNIRVEGKK